MPCVLEKEAKIVKQIRLILEFFFLACSVTFSNFMFRSCMLCYFIVIYLFILWKQLKNVLNHVVVHYRV